MVENIEDCLGPPRAYNSMSWAEDGAVVVLDMLDDLRSLPGKLPVLLLVSKECSLSSS